jgi:hypothetical protein
MGKLLQFPARRHRTAPAVLRASFDLAASETKVIAVTPALRARFVRKIASHHSGGIQSLCHHLETFAAVPAMSEAIPTRDGPQSSMIERNVVNRGCKARRRARSERGDLILPVTPSSLGQHVLNHKVNVSHDCAGAALQNVLMAKGATRTDFKADFTGRVKSARISAGYTQQQIADLLHIDQGKYKQYEGRSFMAYELIPRFCLLTRIDEHWLFTGNQRAAAQPHSERADRPARIKVKRARVA